MGKAAAGAGRGGTSMTTFTIRRLRNPKTRKHRPEAILREYGPLERWRLKELTRMDELSLDAALAKAIGAGFIERGRNGVYHLLE